MRVFVIPSAYPGPNQTVKHKINTLAHYLAMNDDLYCSVIYHQFALNPLCRGAPDRNDFAMNTPFMREQLSQGVQSYLKDACRIMNLKVFKIAVYSQIIEEQVSEEENIGN